MIIKKLNNSITVAKAKSGYYPLQLNIYLYIADGVLIDAGSANMLKETKFFLKKEKISCAAITHVHEDHTGAAAWIKDNLKVPVYLKENSIPEAAVKSKIPLYRRLTWGNREGFIADSMPPVIETGHLRLDVIDAPGHHRDHVVFHEKNEGWLFTGDLYVGRKQVVAFKDENINDAIKSLKKLLKLDFDTVFCAHSGVHNKGKEKLKSKLDFFLEIQGKVRELEQSGLTRNEIDKRIYPERNFWSIISRGEWSTLNVIETI
ncbi:MAG TPA: MBL fold metallo-hydrolase [Spirochaetota bacterium]|nr:MBL fold metallo-hydrolase [Spirochaetota bacterium]HPJ35279.1 MBL fold metallo-hydrolase [Spirochaetota bacterium]